MNTRDLQNVTKLHILCLFRHDNFDILLGELFNVKRSHIGRRKRKVVC